MGTTSRGKICLRRPPGKNRDAFLILVATEDGGAQDVGDPSDPSVDRDDPQRPCAIKTYLTMFECRRVNIQCLPSTDGYSSPDQVEQNLTDFLDSLVDPRDFDPERGDTAWLVVDVDRWPLKKLTEVCTSALQKGYRLAISNPSIEFWFLLHHRDITAQEAAAEQFPNAAGVITALRAAAGRYGKTGLRTEDYKGRVGTAVNRARLLGAAGNWPATPGSHVFRLVEHIREKCGAEMPNGVWEG